MDNAGSGISIQAHGCSKFTLERSTIKQYRGHAEHYQREVAARAIVFAAFHPRRELWVGLPTVRAILARASSAP